LITVYFLRLSRMLLWRISNHTDLSGEGGMVADGRWHVRGQRVVYLSEHPALALLEVLVHFDDPEEVPTSYQLLTIEVPDRLRSESLTEEELGRNAAGWRRSVAECRRMSAPWFSTRPTALLRVPSVIVPGSNYLLNPLHPEASQILTPKVEMLDFDERLISARAPERTTS
jgi:RES domain-containing protein